MKIDHNDGLEQALAEYELADAKLAKIQVQADTNLQYDSDKLREAGDGFERALAAIPLGELVVRYRELQRKLSDAETDRDRWMRIAASYPAQKAVDEAVAKFLATSGNVELERRDEPPADPQWLERRKRRKAALDALERDFEAAPHVGACNVIFGRPCSCGAWGKDQERLEARLRRIDEIEKEFGDG